MAPPRVACESYARFLEAIEVVVERISNIRGNLISAIGLIARVKYGIVDIADVLSADIIAGIGSVASSVSNNLVGSASKMSQAILSGIISQLLKILLAFPTAIFSLVAIPHEQAIVYSRAERVALFRARSNLNMIIAILRKWSKSISGAKYYNQIVAAMPHIKRALELGEDLIEGLQGRPTEPGEPINAKFDKDKYKRMGSSIRSAIEATKPQSVIADQMRISLRIEKSRQAIYKEEAKKIELWYKGERSSLSRWYQGEATRISMSGDSLRSAVESEGVRNKYQFELNKLNTMRKERLARAEMTATVRSNIDGSTYVQAVAGLSEAFKYDMVIIGGQATSFLNNIKDAYLAYRSKQMMCVNIVNNDKLIRNIIAWLIAEIRSIGNAAAKRVLATLERTVAILEVTRDRFDTAATKYEDPTQKISSAQLSTEVVVGHSMLSTADSNMNAFITDSLISLINSDDVLLDASGRFDILVNSLRNVVDWDGRRNIWSVNILESAPPPYTKLISDATRALGAVTSLGFSNNDDDRHAVAASIVNLNKSFRSIQAHNRSVEQILSDYTPYMSSEAGNIKRILASANLLKVFAASMSIQTLVESIVSGVVDNGFNDMIPTYNNCKLYYPDLFSENAVRASALNKINAPAPYLNIAYQAGLESKEYGLVFARERVLTTSFQLSYEQSDMLNGLS